MMRDPYSVLGLPQTATADEVKAAYRKLAKKYHPDLNPGDKEAEKKMQEVNEAYDAIVNHKWDPNASSQQSYGGQSYGYGQQGSYQNSYGRQWTYADPFEGFNFWGNSYQQRRQYNGRANETADLRAARNYINSGMYREALNILNRIAQKDAYWYFLSALANEGIGNRINAVNQAKMAAQMEPDNSEFQDLASRLQYANGANDFYGRNFRMPNIRSNGLLWCCIVNALLNFCCGRGFFCC